MDFKTALAVTAAFWAAGVPAAEWIKGTYVPPAESDVAAFFKPAPNDVLEKTFTTRNVPVKSALWRVTAPGMRDLFVNGTRVTSTALPPLTPYAKRILEETYDVTAQVKSGAENRLRAELGNGWYNPLPLKMWYTYNLREYLAIGAPCIKATLEIEYADGKSGTVKTDASWKCGEGRILRNNLYLGEEVDFRRKTGFVAQASVVAGPAGKVLPAGGFPKTVIYRKWKAKSVSPVGKDGKTWLVDMGVNYAGSFRALVRGVEAGGKVRFRMGERRYADGSVDVRTAVAGQIKRPERGPLFAVAEQRHEIIGDGSETLVYEPRMAFHVFRYIQVEGSGVRPQPEDFEALAWSADLTRSSGFVCSDERLNTLHEMCLRTFRANLQSVQSDCPGREKFGYGGDIACVAEAFWCNWNMKEFYRKTVRDFLNEAEDDGIFTETAPYIGIGSKPVFPPKKPGGRRPSPMGWTLGVPVLLDLAVRYAGDLDIVEEAYPALTRFIGLVHKAYPDHVIPECLGDWIPAISSQKADANLSAHAHWHQFVTLTAKMARHLGKTDDAARYGKLAEEIAVKFRERFVKPGGLAGKGSQGDQLFALYNGLFLPADEPAAYARLKRDINSRGDSLTTGIFATKYMLELLPARGDAELAAKVAMHEGFPGWFHWMDIGATTLWEHWREDASLNVHSNCHPMFGSVDEWMIKHVLGIAVCEDAVGCDKVRIEPKAVNGLTSASGWFDTPKGRITVSWKITDGRIKVESSVPPGIRVM